MPAAPRPPGPIEAHEAAAEANYATLLAGLRALGFTDAATARPSQYRTDTLELPAPGGRTLKITGYPDDAHLIELNDMDAHGWGHWGITSGNAPAAVVLAAVAAAIQQQGDVSKPGAPPPPPGPPAHTATRPRSLWWPPETP